ncbi:hypothetical protein [Christiangramia crocea]|uniref:Uncharacterized protein n=1 Tax=Christiangramia crocea TaxID=2904124 RepID=A0A9X1UYM5_9FLAO|nr:hypothetical protein [Gramella crocea]MCG9972817.1 hypothetical protein [Gramella crocea]
MSRTSFVSKGLITSALSGKLKVMFLFFMNKKWDFNMSFYQQLPRLATVKKFMLDYETFSGPQLENLRNRLQ